MPGRGRGSPGDPLAEECEFKPESMSVRGAHIACVVPPLRAVFGMVEVVAWELVLVARKVDCMLLLLLLSSQLFSCTRL